MRLTVNSQVSEGSSDMSCHWA